ncbi:MAG TPA: ABC transporter substrate-binding protein [Mogibacterium sp.]|nr:ABC transporter substrate-binding protein [Mogibacterium sp.]
MKNGKTVKKIIRALGIVTVMVVVSGCTTFDNFKNTYIDKKEDITNPVITIGVFEPVTGRDSASGKQEIKGIELAHSIYNNVIGYEVRLLKVDTQSSVAASETAIQSLIEARPVAIIGSSGEASSLVASKYIEEAAIPTITPSAVNPLITEGSYYFRACLTGSQIGAGVAEYAYEELGSNKIAIVRLKNDGTTTAAVEGFEDNIKKLAGRKSAAICMNLEINDSNEDIDNAFKEIIRNNADVCYTPLDTQIMDKLFTLVEKYNRTDIIFLGIRNWGEDDFVRMMKKHPDIKVVFPYTSVLESPNEATDALTEETRKFQIEYANMYGSEDIPTDNAARGYDSYLLLINAIHRAGSIEGRDIREALHAFENIKCVTGTFEFDQSGNIIRSVNLSTLKKGKIVSEYTTKKAEKASDIAQIEKAEGEEE